MKHFLELLKNNKKILLLASLLFLFLISFINFIVCFRGSKYTFRYHEAGSDRILYESRVVPSVKNTPKIKLYVEELLLGPSVRRGVPLFPLQTRVIFCFVRGNELFLNLSEQAVMNFSPETDLEESYRMLSDNVCRNFSNIKKVNLFIDGNSVFSDVKIQ
jgi:hypothetical protein